MQENKRVPRKDEVRDQSNPIDQAELLSEKFLLAEFDEMGEFWRHTRLKDQFCDKFLLYNSSYSITYLKFLVIRKHFGF